MAEQDAVAEQDVVSLAADLIRFDTTNRGGGDAREREAAEYVAARLAECGMNPVLLESAPGRANVVARISGSDPAAAGLLLHGHLDVVLRRIPLSGRCPRSAESSATGCCGGGALST